MLLGYPLGLMGKLPDGTLGFFVSYMVVISSFSMFLFCNNYGCTIKACSDSFYDELWYYLASSFCMTELSYSGEPRNEEPL